VVKKFATFLGYGIFFKTSSFIGALYMCCMQVIIVDFW